MKSRLVLEVVSHFVAFEDLGQPDQGQFTEISNNHKLFSQTVKITPWNINYRKIRWEMDGHVNANDKSLERNCLVAIMYTHKKWALVSSVNLLIVL